MIAHMSSYGMDIYFAEFATILIIYLPFPLRMNAFSHEGASNSLNYLLLNFALILETIRITILSFNRYRAEM